MEFTYRVGPVLILTDVPLSLPESAGESMVEPFDPGVPTRDPADGNGWKEVYSGDGLFCGGTHSVRCRDAGTGYLLDVDDSCRFYVEADGRCIERLFSAGSVDMNAAMGPALVLALSLQGQYVLHTSAVLQGSDAVCFLGRSEAGKSTTAAFLGRHLRDARTLVDDMASFHFDGSRLQVFTGFPQPHAPAGTGGVGRAYQVKAMLWLQPGPVDEPGSIARLGAAGLLYRLIGSSVGTKLFNRRLLAEHLQFCSLVAERVPGYLSTCSHTDDSLIKITDWMKGLPTADQ